jgi:hypothetical protein
MSAGGSDIGDIVDAAPANKADEMSKENESRKDIICAALSAAGIHNPLLVEYSPSTSSSSSIRMETSPIRTPEDEDAEQNHAQKAQKVEAKEAQEKDEVEEEDEEEQRGTSILMQFLEHLI